MSSFFVLFNTYEIISYYRLTLNNKREKRRLEIKYHFSRIFSFSFFCRSFPSAPSTISIDSTYDSIRNQIDDLERKLVPVQDIIESLRPKERFSIHDELPVLDYDIDTQTDENYFDDDNNYDDAVEVSLVIKNKDEHTTTRTFSENLYNGFDGKRTSRQNEIKLCFITQKIV